MDVGGEKILSGRHEKILSGSEDLRSKSPCRKLFALGVVGDISFRRFELIISRRK